jgi:hypothetical protein
MSSPISDPKAKDSRALQGTFDAALSHDKDPMKVFARQLALDESTIPQALATTLTHIWLKMGTKNNCESTEIEVEDDLTFGLLSGSFFKTHHCSLFPVDPKDFGRSLSLVLTGRIIDDNLFEGASFQFGPNFDLISIMREVSSSIQTSFTLFHISDNDIVTRVENHFVAEPLNFVLLAMHGSELYDVQVLFYHNPIFFHRIISTAPKIFHILPVPYPNSQLHMIQIIRILLTLPSQTTTLPLNHPPNKPPNQLKQPPTTH